MDAAGAGRPSRETGLPPGVEAGPIAARFVAYLVDTLVPAVVGGVLGALIPTSAGSTRTILVVVGTVVVLAWVVLVWFLLATRAAGPGMRLLNQQLVGFYDGRPLGWGRVFVRALVLWLLTVSGLGLVLMLIFLLLHPRHQGWHDLAANAVMIKARPLAPRTANRPAAEAHPQATGPRPAPVSPPPGYSSRPQAAYPARAPLAPPPGMPVQPPPGSVPSPAMRPGGVQPQQDSPVRVPSAIAEQTAVFPPSGEKAVRWVAALDDGRELPLAGLVLLGRNPQAEPGEEDAQLIKIADETRTVSKSHLAISTYKNLIYVTDRGSTNGSTVTTAEGVSSRCNPGEWVPVANGSIVSIGDHWLEIRRRDG
jgi:uncharacterized RDD family membrane protein YckC